MRYQMAISLFQNFGLSFQKFSKILKFLFYIQLFWFWKFSKNRNICNKRPIDQCLHKIWNKNIENKDANRPKLCPQNWDQISKIIFLKSKNILSDAFWREEHDGIKIIHVALLDKKIWAKNCSAPQNGLLWSAYAQMKKIKFYCKFRTNEVCWR